MQKSRLVKSLCVCAYEDVLIQKSLKMKHEEAIGDLQRQLNDANTKLSARNQTIRELQEYGKDPAIQRKSNSSRIWSKQQRGTAKTTPAPVSARYLGDTIAFKNKRCSTVPHFRPRKLEDSHRSSSKAGGDTADAMAAIISELEMEGYTKEVVSEEAIVHLWREKEKAKKALQQAQSVSAFF